MGQEIERKFLVKPDFAFADYPFCTLRQGYLNHSASHHVRVRVADDHSYITIKSSNTTLRRAEYEYPIPVDDALQLLEDLCEKPLLEKKRYAVLYGGYHWDVDLFLGVNEGLMVAEIELKSEDEEFPRPPWLATEVTGDPRYYNANLVKNPYKSWK